MAANLLRPAGQNRYTQRNFRDLCPARFNPRLGRTYSKMAIAVQPLENIPDAYVVNQNWSETQSLFPMHGGDPNPNMPNALLAGVT